MLSQLFDNDTEFSKLITRDASINVAVAALEIARDANPRLEFGETLHWIAERGRELQQEVATATSERAMLEAIGRCLADKYGLAGTAAAFELSSSSYLPDVIRTGQGIPISLSVIYQAVAQAAGIQLDGIGAPGHFLTSLRTSQGRLFVDAFHDGRVMGRDEAVDLLHELTGLERDTIAGSLEPVRPRYIIMRMLENLRVVHITREDWASAWQAQRRLYALRPGSYDDLRDLAIFAFRSHRAAEAFDHVQACLTKAPATDHDMLQKLLKETRRELAAMN